MTILVVQNAEAAPVGLLGAYLTANGLRLQTWSPLQRSAPPAGDYSGLIILGGPMNACEDDAFPHLQRVMDLIHHFDAAHQPILGICLGAQLIARAFGSRIYPNPVPELGFTQIYPVATKTNEPLLSSYSPNLHMMQWHFDTFDLPAQAELLMSSQNCPNQFYRIRHNIYGVQFHPEVTPDIIRGWLAFKTDWIQEHDPSLLQDLELQIKQHWRCSTRFAKNLAQAWSAKVSTTALKTIP